MVGVFEEMEKEHRKCSKRKRRTRQRVKRRLVEVKET